MILCIASIPLEKPISIFSDNILILRIRQWIVAYYEVPDARWLYNGYVEDIHNIKEIGLVLHSHAPENP
jgi:hypothetical protein